MPPSNFSFNTKYSKSSAQRSHPHPVAANRSGLVRLHHPGYEDGSSHLLTLRGNDGPSGQLWFDLAHTACAIIAGNRFDGFLSTEKHSLATRLERKQLLHPGVYYFHVPADSGAIATSLPTTSSQHDEPPNPPSPAMHDPTPGKASADQRRASKNPYRYPVVPSFEHWTFPTNIGTILGREDWLEALSSSESTTRPIKECQITGSCIHNEKSHVFPAQEASWFFKNSMGDYFPRMESHEDRAIHNNILTLRPDVHHMWDQNVFTFFPKVSNDGRPEMVSHCFRDEASLLGELHNCPILHPHTLSPEAFLARFAWSIFPHLESFLSHQTKRLLLVKDTNGLSVPQLKTSYEARTMVQSRSNSPKKRKPIQQDMNPTTNKRQRSEDSGVGGFSSFCDETSDEQSASDVSAEDDLPRGRKRRRTPTGTTRRVGTFGSASS